MLDFVPVHDTPEDYAEFEKLEEGFYRHYTKLGIGEQFGRLPYESVPPELVRKEFDRYIQGNGEQDSYFMFVKIGTQVVGYVCGWIKNKNGCYADPRIAHLESLYLNESERGKGYSSSMAEAFFSWARSKGVRACQLEVYAKNRDALAVYKKWGFEEDELILWKPL